MRSIQELSDRMDLCLKQNKLDEFVRLINNEWDFRKKLSNTFDVPVLRQAWAFGKKQGAVSRKACGAGGGGALLLMFKNKTARDRAVAQKLPSKDWQWISLAAVDDGFFA